MLRDKKLCIAYVCGRTVVEVIDASKFSKRFMGSDTQCITTYAA